MAIELNVTPYFDDYDETKEYYKILFRPGLAVQARELTQLQTALQKQIQRMGTHFFKEGAKVLDAAFSYTEDFHSVKLTSLFNGISVDDYIEQYVGVELRGETSGVVGRVVHYDKSTETDPPTLYVSYTKTGYDTETDVFQDAERLVATDKSVYTFLAEEASVSTAPSNCAAIGASAAIESGVFYTLGHFVYVPAQRIVLSKYTNNPSARVGLMVEESIVKHTEDNSLLDNAQGTPNFAAPGADRYSISLVLTALDPSVSPSKSFIELERVNTGRVVAKVRTSEYNVLEDNLAKRTYDTNGDYIVDKFRIKMRESVDDGANEGVYPLGQTTDDGNTAATDLLALQVSEGKAFVKGYSIQTTQPSFIDVEKPRTYKEFLGTSIPVEIGNYTYINNLNNIPDIVSRQGNTNFDPYTPLTLSDGANVIGVSRARSLEFSDATNTGVDTFSNEQYKLFLFDVKMFTTVVMDAAVSVIQGAKVKGQFSNAEGYVYADSTTNTFELINVNGTFSVGEPLVTTTTDAVLGANIQTVTAHSFSEVRQFASPIDNFSADAVTYQDTDIVTGALGAPYAKIEDPNNNFMLRPLPKQYVKTLETDRNFNLPVSSIEVRREFEATTNNVGEFTLTCGAGETFNAPSNLDYQISIVTAGTGGMAAGSTVNVDSANLTVVGGGSNSITFTSAPIFGDGALVKVFATINRQNAASKAKVANTMSTVMVVDNTNNGAIYGTSVHHSEISLGVADTYKVRAIYNSGVAGVAPTPPTLTVTGTTGAFLKGERFVGQTSSAVGSLINPVAFTYVAEDEDSFVPGEVIVGQTSGATATVSAASAGSLNVIDRYLLDSGQRDNFYDISRLVLKPRSARPIGNLLVVFDYFDHNEGDFFSVDSYSDITYEEIPYYSKGLIDLSKGAPVGSDLRNYIDFRPRVADIATTVVDGYNVVSAPSFDFNARTYSYLITSASVINTPKDNANFECEFEYYLGRKDALFLTSEGQFKYIKGVDDESPVAPTDLDNALRLADISLNPYVFDMFDVNVVTHTARRYTMKDISRLDKRLGNVEYYTSLSLLEQEAASMQIKDANGLDRFKAGFIVDEFTGHGIGNVSHPDYRCSVDMRNKTLRPKYVMKNINLQELNDIDTDRATAGYQVTNDIATLPYTHTPIITQSKASAVENVNPVLKITWVGCLNLTPSMDTWFETERLPAITQNEMGNFDSVVAENENAIGTIWDAPTTQWSGTPTREVETTTERVETSTTRGRTRTRERVTETTILTETGVSTRKGIRTDVIPEITYSSQGDKIVGNSLIPYMRENWIYFEGCNFKPNTRVYAFFDNKDVSSYISPTGGKVVAKVPATAVKTFTPGVWSFLSDVTVSFDNNRNSAVVFELEYSDSVDGPFVSAGTVTSANVKSTRYSQLTFQIPDSIILPNDFGEKYVRITVKREDGSPLSGKRVRDRDEDESRWKSRRKRRAAKEPTKFINTKLLNSPSAFQLIDINFTNQNGVRVGTDHLEVVSFNNFMDPQNAIDDVLVDANTDSDKFRISESPVPNSGMPTATMVIKVSDGTAVKAPSTTTVSFTSAAAVEPTALVTDSAGKISGWFNLPDPSVLGNPRFETGTRQFRLTSDPNNGKTAVKTFGDADYTASGTLTKLQETIVATKNAIVRKTEVSETTEVTRSTQTTDTRFKDPLAQSFAIDLEGGCFVTKVDLYFSTKDNALPVSVELRTMENGIPTRTVIPGSQVSLNPESINISTDGSVPTTFTFANPIFLEKHQEVALAILSNSMNYNVYISRMGEDDILTGDYISEQPYLGVLFKSQNSSTWTAYDYEDLKFTLYRAQFEVGTGVITFNNTMTPDKHLGTNPFEIITDATGAPTNVVKVTHKDHQMYRQGFNDVTISGASTGIYGTLRDDLTNVGATIILDNPIEGFPTDGLTTYNFIVRADVDETLDEVVQGIPAQNPDGSITITVSARSVNGVTTSHAAGADVELYEVGGISLDEFNATHTIDNIGIDSYTFTLSAAPTVAGSVGGSEVYASENILFDSYQFMVPTITLPNTSITTSASMVTGTSHTGGQGSYANFTPGSVVLGDRQHLNYPCMVASATNESRFLSGAKSLTLRLTLSTTADNISPVVAMDRYTFTGFHNRINYIDSATQVYPQTEYRDGTQPINDSGESVYVTRKIELETPANSIKTFIGLSHTSESKVSILYKIQRVDDDRDFDDIEWQYYNGDGQPDTPYQADNSGQFIDHTYSVDNLDEFSAFAIKIKMDGTNSSKPPRAIDLRAIALAT